MVWAVLSVFIWTTAGCGMDTQQSRPLPDTLIVGTLYSPTGFFTLHEDTLGYDYDRICDFARSHGVVLRFKVARSMGALLDWVEQDSVQLLACEIPITAEYKQRVIPCGAVNETYQVLVQPSGDSVIDNVTQLVGKQVWVERDSKYEARLRNLNNEIGGGIDIRTVKADTIMPEDLIDMVGEGKLPMTVVDSDIATMNLDGDGRFDFSLRISFAQRSSWAVAIDHQWLADTIDAWAQSINARAYSKNALKRYFSLSKALHVTPPEEAPPIPKGALSPYDSLFQTYAKEIDWDWRLLAAVSYAESGFNPYAVSWAGARGIMQLMPRTAVTYGLDPDELVDPEKCLNAAVRVIRDLNKKMAPLVPDSAECVKFILASYNAGPGHVLDAIALAKKFEKDPTLWDGNVEEAILWKQSPEFYNDSVCRFGFFRGRQTVDYVARIEQQYHFYQNKFKP